MAGIVSRGALPGRLIDDPTGQPQLAGYRLPHLSRHRQQFERDAQLAQWQQGLPRPLLRLGHSTTGQRLCNHTVTALEPHCAANPGDRINDEP